MKGKKMENMKRLYQVEDEGLLRQLEAGKNIVFTSPARTGKGVMLGLVEMKGWKKEEAPGK